MNNHQSRTALDREGLDALPPRAGATRGFPHPDYDHSDGPLEAGRLLADMERINESAWQGDVGHTVPALDVLRVISPEQTYRGHYRLAHDRANRPVVVNRVLGTTCGPYSDVTTARIVMDALNGDQPPRVKARAVSPLSALAADVAIVRRASERAMTARGLPPSMDEPREDSRPGGGPSPGEVPEQAPRRPGGERGPLSPPAPAIASEYDDPERDEFPNASRAAEWVAVVLLAMLAAGVAIGFLAGWAA